MLLLEQIVKAGQEAIDFCFPPTCRVCESRAAQWPLCEACVSKLEALEAQAYCQLCGLPLSEHAAPCPHCLGEGVFPFDRVLRLCNYDDPVKHLIHALKFRRAWPIGEFLADRLLARPPVQTLLENADLIVPVPLHAMRQVQRGYNQAKVIARRLGRRARVRVAAVAVRLANTEAQTETHSKSQRIENLRHAFGLLDPSRVAGRRVVIVDDVRTTAATLQSFGRCIRAGKPSSIAAIVVAAADARHSHFEAI